MQARISLGRHGELCAEIEALVGEHPFRERLWEQWMLTLYRSGRQADALRAYQRVRRLLGDELGIEPGDSLRRLEDAILAHDPALDWALERSAPSVVRPPVDRSTGNLPPAPPQLFGRSDAVADIAGRLQTTRILSLVGVGGVGKTSVSLAVAHAVRDRYPDGVWFVELAPVSEADSVAVVVAGAFNHQAQSGVTVSESVGRLLARKEALLVLDNCEHVLDGVSAFVELLIRSTSSLDVLLTSREGLGVAEEQQITVAPLPTDGAEAAAIELFVARASQIVDSFEIDETNVHDVIAICHELDGLPLAIELAATRVRTLAPAEIRERLSDRLRLLSGGRGRAERHQTMRRTVEWSYQLLTPAESVLLNRLSVFAGGFTLAAAEDVCDGPPLERDAVLDALDSLVAKSLVVAEVRRGTTRLSPARDDPPVR